MAMISWSSRSFRALSYCTFIACSSRNLPVTSNASLKSFLLLIPAIALSHFPSFPKAIDERKLSTVSEDRDDKRYAGPRSSKKTCSRRSRSPSSASLWTYINKIVRYSSPDCKSDAETRRVWRQHNRIRTITSRCPMLTEVSKPLNPSFSVVVFKIRCKYRPRPIFKTSSSVRRSITPIVPWTLLPAGGLKPDASQYWLVTAHHDSLNLIHSYMSREYVYASPLPKVMTGYPARVIPTLVILAVPTGSVKDIEALSRTGASETGGWGELRNFKFLLSVVNYDLLPYVHHSYWRYT